MEKIQIFEDLMNKIQLEENRDHLLIGDKISATNGNVTDHNIIYHIEDLKDRLYYNGTLREMKSLFPLIIPVLKYEQGYTKKMNIVSHQHRLTGCEMIMVAGKKPRLYEVIGSNAYSHKEIGYGIINREEFYKWIDNAKTLENSLGNKIKELSKVYH